MTAYSPYQAYPGPVPVLVAPPPIFVAVSDPVPQRRITVAFRMILAIPHLFLLYWLALAAGVVVFLGWWAALFTGRLPQFAVTFLSGVLRWATRVHAYNTLLTDVYPPFTLDDDPAYPVRVAIPEPQPLNRAAVFFRYFLTLPVAILVGIVIFGAGTLMAFAAWLITLIAGQLPPALYQAYVAVVRFQARYYGYWWMLTPAYPGGLYGDKPGAVAWADALPTAQAPGYGTPGYGNPVDSAPGGYSAPQGYEPTQGVGAPQPYDGFGAPQPYSAPGYGAAPEGYGVPAPVYGTPGGFGVRPVFQPATWLLPLTSAAKSLVTSFIVLGALFLGGYVVLYGVIIGSAISSVSDTQAALTAANQLNDSYNTLSSSMNTWEQSTSSCNQNLTCVTKQDVNAANAFQAFSAQLANTPVPGGAAADKARLSAAAASAAQDFTLLSKSTTTAQYQSTINSTGLQQALDRFDQDFTALINQLDTN